MMCVASLVTVTKRAPVSRAAPEIVCSSRSVGEVTGSTTGVETPQDVGVVVGVGELVDVGVEDGVATSSA